jgi:AraC family L-rhamnose operon transcriptional activator RhaR/AraC family L-rhamnose operon regulatory protein RhaS
MSHSPTNLPSQTSHNETKIPEYFPNANLPIGFWREVDQAPGPPHSHDFTEVAIVESGRGKHLFENRELDVSVGDVFVIKPGYSHAWVSTQEMTVINLMISQEHSIPLLGDLSSHHGFCALFNVEPQLRNSSMGGDRLRLDAKTIREIKATTIRLNHSLAQNDKSHGTMALIHCLSIISILCEQITLNDSPSNKNIVSITKVFDFMENHYHKSIQVEDLAKLVNLSNSSLFRLFEQSMNTTPIAYLNQLRLEKACDLLRSTHQSITDIAFDVGFSDSNYFSRTFKKFMGSSPRDYRNSTNVKQS